MHYFLRPSHRDEVDVVVLVGIYEEFGGYNVAENEVRAACDLSLKSGDYTNPARNKFYGPPVLAEPSKLARDAGSAEKLWEVSEKCVGSFF